MTDIVNPLNIFNPVHPWYHTITETGTEPHEVIQVTTDMADKADVFGLFGVVSLVVVCLLALSLFIWAIFFKE